MNVRDDLVEMTTKEAIKHVADYFSVTSYYALAKSLSDDEMTVQPIQISKYKRGSKMSKKVADRFAEVYGIHISDIHQPGKLGN